MILGSIVALGIDISEDKIKLALLKRSRRGVEFVRTVEGLVPEGAIKDGNIVDAAALTKAIKQLKRKIRARSAKTAVALFARPALLQIVEMPAGLPTNMRQFVANEIKQCVVLPCKRVAFDFCGINLGKKAHDKRIFVAAADGVGIAETGYYYSQGVLNIEVIEPAIIACTRALYTKKIAGKFESNVLIAMLHNGVMNLCVFKNQAIDFVRTKIIDEQTKGAELCRWLAEQINEVIQFYDVEVADSDGKWEITVVSDSIELPAEAKDILKTEIQCADLDIRTRRDGLRDTGIIGAEKSAGTSLVAAGLAMKLLDVKDHGLKINLFPPTASESKLLRTDFLLAANAMAITVLFLVLVNGVLTFAVKKTQTAITEKSRNEQLKQTFSMIHKLDLINQQIKQYSERPADLNKLQSLQRKVDWSNLFNDIRTSTPKTVRIVNLYGNVKNKVIIEGLAISYESIHLFVNMLNRSQYIEEASLAGTEKKQETNGLIKYSINCVLSEKEEK